MELHDHLHLRNTHWDDDLFVILPWSPNGASFGPFNQAHTIWYLNVLMLLLLGDISLMYRPDSIMDMDDWDCTFDDGWSNFVWFFSIYHTSNAILGHISLSIEIYRFSWSCMIISTYEIHIEMMTCLLTYYDPLVEPFLDHSIMPTLFDI